MIPSLESRFAHRTHSTKGAVNRFRPLFTVAAAVILTSVVAGCSRTTTPVAAPPTHVSNPPGHVVTARPMYVTNPPTVTVGSAPDGLAFDAGTHTLYATNQNSNSVSVVNTETCNGTITSSCGESVSTISLGTSTDPQGVALDANTDTVYVADNGGGISVIDGATCNAQDASGCEAPLARIADPAGPLALAVDQLTDTVYVVNFGQHQIGTGNTVSVINGTTCNSRQTDGCDQVPATVKVGPAPTGVAVDPNTDTVYVSNGGLIATQGHTVSVFNGATCGATQTSGCASTPETIDVGRGPNWIALDLNNGTAYTPNQADNDVSVIDIATCNATVISGCSQKTATIHVGVIPWALAVDQSLHTLYVANNQDETLSVIDTNTCNATTHSSCSIRPPTLQVGGGPQAVAVDPSTNTVYTANFNDNTVSVTDVASCNADVSTGCRRQLPTAQAGSTPQGMAVVTATHSLYVADAGSNTVSVINTAGCNASTTAGCDSVATIHVGSNPTGVAIDLATHSLYVTDAGGRTVSVIDTSACNAEVQSGCGRTPAEVTVGTQPFGIALDQTTDTVYVTDLGINDLGDTVSVIDGATCNGGVQSGCGQKTPEVTVASGPFGIAVNPTTDTVYVANTGQLYSGAHGHTVSVINGSICNAVQTSGCGHPPTTVEVGRAPFGIAVDDATNTIYVVDNQGGESDATLSTIDGTTCDATETSGCIAAQHVNIGLGRAPHAVALDPSTHTLYTANHINATVSAIDLDGPASDRIARRFAVGSAPEDLIVDPADQTVYVTNSLDGTISVLAL